MGKTVRWTTTRQQAFAENPVLARS
jgi:hypothetical protein